MSSAFEDLIEALTIMSKYNPDATCPTHCEHDIMYVMVEGEDITEEDLVRLEELGFEPDDDVENMSSFRFGSA